MLLKQLRSFSKGRECVAAGAVSAAEIERWLYDNDWATKTRHGALLTLRTLFDFAMDRSYVALNPARAVDLPAIESEPPGIHTPEEVATVLESCSNPSTLRFLAIRYFAGLRGSEAAALTESEIHLDRKFIEVPARKSKTRQRRLVTIQPNLAAWLKHSKTLEGALPLRQVNNRLAEAVKESGVKWPQNVTRHSFVSYHLAHFQSAGKTALEAGHSEQMLFNHHREIVTPEDAEAFWGIVPRPK